MMGSDSDSHGFFFFFFAIKFDTLISYYEIDLYYY